VTVDDDSSRFSAARRPVAEAVACVLLFSLGRPLMPVDTHVRHVALQATQDGVVAA
jgi:hypothetical protein